MALNVTLSERDDNIELAGKSDSALGFISPETYFHLQVIQLWTSTAMTGAGLITNAFNIFAFFCLGLNDPVSTSLFVLSLADFCSFLFVTFLCVFQILTVYVETSTWSFNPFLLSLYVYRYNHIFYTMSLVTNMFIAVARCCCVSKALQFRHFFTLRRTHQGLVIMFAVSLAVSLPTIVTQEVRWLYLNNGNNVTSSARLLILPKQGHRQALDFHNIFNLSIFHHTCVFITFICLSSLVRTLKKMSKFRHQNSSSLTSTSRPSIKLAVKSSGTALRCDNTQTVTPGPTGKHTGSALNSKELQVVKLVSVLTAIFVSSRLVIIVIATMHQIFPEFGSGKRYHNLYYTCFSLGSIYSYGSAAANSIVYYKFNTKYRLFVLQQFCSGVQDDKAFIN
ncbi:orexin receptor type 1-like [Aplysia californica]|uniref:Orexin receptor type 1-like n=1 Tax=Aplysia californica TaxID=6500 RepID=A0ABM1AA25_APLCA|nr:orexin receptor type 1-like [Aplysia californica]